jgi:2-keto-3-deoxy-L-rhamnonate aldolase RhmA
MRGSAMKAAWRSGKPSVGAWLSLSDPSTTEIMANIGFDWLLFDGEHSPIPVERLQTLLMAFNGRATLPFYRVNANDPALIGQVLDIGAAGVVVPKIESVTQAKAALNAARYPPLGHRGVGPWRAAGYGADYFDYVHRANDEIIVMLMIESLAGIAALPEIVRLPGVDGIIAGPADLAASLGHSPNFEHPDVLTAIDRLVDICHSANMPVAVSMNHEERLAAWQARGAKLILAGVDSDFILAGANDALAFARSMFTGNQMETVR